MSKNTSVETVVETSVETFNNFAIVADNAIVLGADNLADKMQHIALVRDFKTHWTHVATTSKQSTFIGVQVLTRNINNVPQIVSVSPNGAIVLSEHIASDDLPVMRVTIETYINASLDNVVLGKHERVVRSKTVFDAIVNKQQGQFVLGKANFTDNTFNNLSPRQLQTIQAMGLDELYTVCYKAVSAFVNRIVNGNLAPINPRVAEYKGNVTLVGQWKNQNAK